MAALLPDPLLSGSATLHSNGGIKARGPGDLRRVPTTSTALAPFVRLVRNPMLTLECVCKSLPELYAGGSDKGGAASSDSKRQLLCVKLKNATSYEEWREAATELDKVEGNDVWKYESDSSEYDANLVQARLRQLDEARLSRDVSRMLFLIRTSLTRGLGGMGDLRLYRHSRIGTKRLIERYIDAAKATLTALLTQSSSSSSSRDDCPSASAVDSRVVLEQLLAARQAFGRSALLLSGGGTFGMNHVGVVKALWHAKLLPRIISGSSAGSIVCAVLCTKTDVEVPDVLDNFFDGDLAVFESEDEGILGKAARFLKIGALFDISNLVRVMRDLLGDITFQEAYNRTRRILNITVSSAGLYELPRLLNYVTAPNVMIWSAVAASCSVPLIFSAAQLMAKDLTTGKEVPWNPSPQRWIDGSVDNDLPMTRLAELFNVNHFIVSQVNPHVVPFLERDEDPLPSTDQPAFTPGPGWLHSMASLAKVEALHRMHVLAELGVFPNYFTKVRSVLSQKYSGDITIVPEISYTNFPRVLSNPTAEFMLQAMLSGERATWPKLSRIQNHCAIELALDDAVQKLRAHVVFSPSQVDLRLNVMSGSRTLKRRGSDRGHDRHSSRGRTKSSRSVAPAMHSSATLPPRLKISAPAPEIPLRHHHSLPYGMHDTHGKIPGPDIPSSSGESSPSVLSDNEPAAAADDDNHSVTSSDSPPSPLPELWPSTRQLFPSTSQPTTPGFSWRTAYPPPAVAASLIMTPTAPVSPETQYKRLFHRSSRHVQGSSEPSGSAPVAEAPRGRPRSEADHRSASPQPVLPRPDHASQPTTSLAASSSQNQQQQPRQPSSSSSATPAPASTPNPDRTIYKRRSFGPQPLQLDMSGTRGMVLRRKRSLSSGIKGGLKSLGFGSGGSKG